MKLFNNWFSKPKQQEERSTFADWVGYSPVGGNYTQSKALLLSAAYRCVDVISDAVAQLPIELYTKGKDRVQLENNDSFILNTAPNELMTRFNFMKVLVVSVLLHGNGYALIRRDKDGNLTALEFVNSQEVSVQYDKIRKKLAYVVNGERQPVQPKDMIHILNFSYDGIVGVSTLTHAKNTLGLSLDSENHAQGFFKGGANLAGILKVQGALTGDQKQKMKQAWQMAFSPNTGTPNGVAILEGNMGFEPITVNPADAQLLETRQFNVVDICRFFGVAPTKCFDLTHASYSTVEASQLAFLTDTIAPMLQKIELEFERKLFGPVADVKFDTSVLLRADKAGEASFMSQLFNMGAITVNEIRRRYDMPAIEGGDAAFVQSNVMPLEQAKQNGNQQTIINNESN